MVGREWEMSRGSRESECGVAPDRKRAIGESDGHNPSRMSLTCLGS